MSDYISDIDAVSEQLNVRKFHLLGHSWSGLYAQIYAKERPEKIESLFLCSPSSVTNEIWKKKGQYERRKFFTREIFYNISVLHYVTEI